MVEHPKCLIYDFLASSVRSATDAVEEFIVADDAIFVHVEIVK